MISSHTFSYGFRLLGECISLMTSGSAILNTLGAIRITRPSKYQLARIISSIFLGLTMLSVLFQDDSCGLQRYHAHQEPETGVSRPKWARYLPLRIKVMCEDSFDYNEKYSGCKNGCRQANLIGLEIQQGEHHHLVRFLHKTRVPISRFVALKAFLG